MPYFIFSNEDIKICPLFALIAVPIASTRARNLTFIYFVVYYGELFKGE
jgi:hypothetical protein